jgi:preprotein translocase SecE subunit
MAVAVKNPPGVRSSSLYNHPALISLLGVLYVLGCLGIVFGLIPRLWWETWNRGFVSGSLLGLLMLAVAVALLVVGAKLLGPNPPVGVRAGIFVGLVGFAIVLLLARWASLWVEHWVYDDRWFGANGPKYGAIISGVIALLLLLGWIRLFTRKSTQRLVVALDEGGWFSATAYKPSQGQKVRRGTIFGILVLVAAGIYTMISHNTVGRTSPDWDLDIPFTGTVAIGSLGDTQTWLAKPEVSSHIQIQVRTPGATNLQPGQVVRPKDFAAKVVEVVEKWDLQEYDKAQRKEYEKVRQAIQAAAAKASEDPAGLVLTINEQLVDRMNRLLDPDAHFFTGQAQAARELRDRVAGTPWANIGPLVDEFTRWAETLGKASLLGPVFELPTGVLLVDRYTLRDINDKTDPKEHVRVGVVTDDRVKLKEDEIVSTSEFDEAVAKARAKDKRIEVPEKKPLQPAAGPTHFASLPLLPNVRYTLPLLLIALSLWMAWRVVNMPSFADFLIATEAELNKVSWTTQRRLVQDTIVVLATVLLMAGYLFAMDQAWRVILSYHRVGVLVFPKDDSETNTSVEQKKW